MTISSSYTPEVYPVNPSRTYTFTFQSVGEESVVVSWRNAAGDEFSVSTSDYTVTMGGQPPLYDGGTVVFNDAPPAAAVEYVFSRFTPRTQETDYRPYGPFPAETHEFALDKLTLIMQETVAGGSGGSVDPNAFVPIGGTRRDVPITGIMEHASFSERYTVGIAGLGFGYSIVDQTQQGQFSMNIGGKLTAMTKDGELLLPTTYDGSESSNAAATVQFVLDNAGGGGGSFIPLTGTTPGNEASNAITWESGAGKKWSVGLNVTFPDALLISKSADGTGGAVIIIASDTGNVNSWAWGFQETGELTMPDIDYNLVADTSAVSKGYVDSVAGVGAFIPTAGTDPSFPVTGPVQWEDSVTGERWQITEDTVFNESLFIEAVPNGARGSVGIRSVSETDEQFWFSFRYDGALILPQNVVYDDVPSQAVVTKGWIQSRHLIATAKSKTAFGRINPNGTKNGGSPDWEVARKAGEPTGVYRITFDDVANGQGNQSIVATAFVNGILVNCMVQVINSQIADVFCNITSTGAVIDSDVHFQRMARIL